MWTKFGMTKDAFKKQVFHPVLIGVLFLFNELRANFKFYPWMDIVSLISIILLFSFFFHWASRKIFKDKIKAGIIASFFVVINIFYLDITNFFLSIYSFNHSEVFFIPFLGLLWLLLVLVVVKAKQALHSLNFYLNFVVILFILVEATKWIFVPVNEIKLTNNFETTKFDASSIDYKPDIYYIILDSYTSSESLKKYWGFYNSAFEDSLKKEGFYVAHKSKSDYISTPLCIASYLNCSMLDSLGVKNRNEHNLNQLITNNRVADYLSSLGYSLVNYSLFDLANRKKFYPFFTYTHYLGRTIWYVNWLKFKHYLYPSSDLSHTNLKIFSLLQTKRIEMDHPVFIYAHLMMPHIPFNFDENGYNPSLQNENIPDERKYLKQLIYTNKLALQTIKKIKENSTLEPIIIIQGDHGYRRLTNAGLAEKTNEAHTIFNAYYFPSKVTAFLNDSIRPANTFRIILNHCFGQRLPVTR